MPVTMNDVILIEELLVQRRKELAPDMSESDFFQIFAGEQVLKDHDLSYDEIRDGIVDGGGDGGIDAVYFFVDNTLYREEIEQEEVRRNVSLELVFIQAKKASGFSEEGMNRLISSTGDLLDLNKNLSTLSTVYKADLLGKIREFRETYVGLMTKFPKLSVRYYYAALATEVHPNVNRKVEKLQDTVAACFSPVDFSCLFLGATELLDLVRRSPSSAHHLKLAENPISTGQGGFVCLVGLTDYCDFIRDEDGKLREDIFEGNVRDYQGNTEVNQQIRETLTSPPNEDFWWLNNGITVICTSVTLSGKTLTIENAEIVNGLQTSREIFDALSSQTIVQKAVTHSVLVRVLVPKEEASRDRIIKATNSQTSIPRASLRATDKIHRDIEDFLRPRGFYYDRRKNYYKNQGKPVKKVVSIPYIAQAVLACGLSNPANARARPTSLLKNDETYKEIFNEAYPLDLYFKCASLVRRVEDVLRSDVCIIDREHWNNIRFYVAMLLALRLTGLPVPTVKSVANIDLRRATDTLILECICAVWKHYSALRATDQIAKGTQLGGMVLDSHKEDVS